MHADGSALASASVASPAHPAGAPFDHIDVRGKSLRAGFWAFVAALCLSSAVAAQGEDIELERDRAASAPSHAPLKAWQTVSRSLPESIVIRRIAFAGHGVFVFFSPAGSDDMKARFYANVEGRLEPEQTEDREPGLCRSPGVAVEQVAPALNTLLADPVWQQHAARMETLALECHRDALFWMLMPMPAGGYQEGVAIPTYDLPFTAAAAPELERR